MWLNNQEIWHIIEAAPIFTPDIGVKKKSDFWLVGQENKGKKRPKECWSEDLDQRTESVDRFASRLDKAEDKVNEDRLV